jgi:hypothetical protein
MDIWGACLDVVEGDEPHIAAEPDHTRAGAQVLLFSRFVLGKSI